MTAQGPPPDSPRALPEELAPARLASLLATKRLGRVYEPYARAGSTNDLIAQRARDGAEEGLVVLADEQSGGRGQKGRTWFSSPGENLTFSLLLRPDRPIASLPPLTLLAGVAIAEALTAIGLRPRLKWPNDVLCDTVTGPRKLVGVLTDMATQRDHIKHVIVGIGINVNQTSFAPEITALATSVRQQVGQPIDRGALLARVLEAFERRYDDSLLFGPASFLETWRVFADLPRACTVDRPQGVLSGTAIDVDADGALVVADAEGAKHRVLSGELTSL